jgi:hypothetical protein
MMTVVRILLRHILTHIPFAIRQKGCLKPSPRIVTLPVLGQLHHQQQVMLDLSKAQLPRLPLLLL